MHGCEAGPLSFSCSRLAILTLGVYKRIAVTDESSSLCLLLTFRTLSLVVSDLVGVQVSPYLIVNLLFLREIGRIIRNFRLDTFQEFQLYAHQEKAWVRKLLRGRDRPPTRSHSDGSQEKSCNDDEPHPTPTVTEILRGLLAANLSRQRCRIFTNRKSGSLYCP